MRIKHATEDLTRAIRICDNEVSRLRFIGSRDAANKLQGILNELEQLKKRLVSLSHQHKEQQ